MAASTPTRIGQVNQAGDTRALFLKKFGGRVLTAFRRKTAFRERHMVQQISSGKSFQFPAIGRVGSGYHTPGDELLGRQINDAEQVITVDDIMESDVFLAEQDEAISHFDVRSEYAYQMGEELANVFDTTVARVGIIAARNLNPVSDLQGTNDGEVITSANALTDADALASAIFDAAQAFDEKDVPDSNRWAFVKPAEYYRMVESSSKAIHRDYGGEGSYASGLIMRIAGLPIVKTNNLPQADDSSNTDLKSKYRDDFSTTAALVMHKSAVGTVQLRSLSTRVDYDPRRLGTLMVAKMLVGHGQLRPDAAAEIRTGAPTNLVNSDVS